MTWHEITSYGFTIMDNSSMTKPYNYDYNRNGHFLIQLKKHI